MRAVSLALLGTPVAREHPLGVARPRAASAALPRLDYLARLRAARGPRIGAGR